MEVQPIEEQRRKLDNEQVMYARKRPMEVNGSILGSSF